MEENKDETINYIEYCFDVESIDGKNNVNTFIEKIKQFLDTKQIKYYYTIREHDYYKKEKADINSDNPENPIQLGGGPNDVTYPYSRIKDIFDKINEKIHIKNEKIQLQNKEQQSTLTTFYEMLTTKKTITRPPSDTASNTTPIYSGIVITEPTTSEQGLQPTTPVSVREDQGLNINSSGIKHIHLYIDESIHLYKREIIKNIL
jgi:hypothetical protein